MQVLADAPGPLDRKELAELSGVHPHTVLTSMRSPRAVGWVTTKVVPTEKGHGRKWLFTLTDTGRRALADHIKENTSS